MVTRRGFLEESFPEMPSDGYAPLATDLVFIQEGQYGETWHSVKSALPYLPACEHQSGRGGNCGTSREVLVKRYDGSKGVYYLKRIHGVRAGSGAMTTSYSWYPNGLPVCNSQAWRELP